MNPTTIPIYLNGESFSGTWIELTIFSLTYIVFGIILLWLTLSLNDWYMEDFKEPLFKIMWNNLKVIKKMKLW